MHAINANNGTLKWLFYTDSTITSTPAIGSDGTVYFGTGVWGEKIYALDGETGTKKWEYKTGKSELGVKSSPAIGKDGTVYVGSGDGKTYALDGKTGARKWMFRTNS